MKRSKLLALGLGLALVALFATPAAAQDGPSITAEPASVDAAGSAEITITGSGWTAAPPIFVLPCAGAEGNLDTLVELGVDACDTGNLTPATPDADGNFTVTVTYDIPDVGLAISAGDAGQTESATALVAVAGGGEGEEGAEGGEEEATEEEATEEEATEEEATEEEATEEEATEEEATEEEATEGAAEETEGAALADTGVETALMVIIGMSILLAGLMVLGLGRRFAGLR